VHLSRSASPAKSNGSNSYNQEDIGQNNGDQGLDLLEYNSNEVSPEQDGLEENEPQVERISPLVNIGGSSPTFDMNNSRNNDKDQYGDETDSVEENIPEFKPVESVPKNENSERHII
jgi:hypothetical protein